MGEIADMMLDGILCAGCGAAMDDVADDDFQAPGHPRYCCNACKPASERKPERPQEFIRSGRKKKARPFRYSIGSKVVHSVNPSTGKSWCQFENNLMRGGSVAFGGPPPIVEFSERNEKPHHKDCKNCALLLSREQARK